MRQPCPTLSGSGPVFGSVTLSEIATRTSGPSSDTGSKRWKPESKYQFRSVFVTVTILLRSAIDYRRVFS